MAISPRKKGFFAGAVALLLCPCHLPLTIPLLLTLTAGTAVGVWMTAHIKLVVYLILAIFALCIGLMFMWLLQNPPACELKQDQDTDAMLK